MPYPATIGGGLMGYSATVDTGLVVPIAGFDGEFSDNGNTFFTANLVMMVAWWCPSGMIVSAMRTSFAVGGNGHYDMGIYDSSGANNDPGTLLAHCASTNSGAGSLATANGIVSPTLIGGNLALSPGNYWLALVVDNATDKMTRHTNLSVTVGPLRQFSGAVPLGAVGSLSNLGSSKPIIGVLRANSWS